MAAALELELLANQRDAVQNPPMGGDPAPLPDGWLEAEHRERHLALRARASDDTHASRKRGSHLRQGAAYIGTATAPLAATITPASLVAVARESAHEDAIESRAHPAESLRAHGRVKTGQAFWAAFETRIRRLDAQVHARWRRMASR